MPNAFATPTPVAAAPVAALPALTAPPAAALPAPVAALPALPALTAPPAAALPAPATAPTAALPALTATSTAALPAPATAPAGEHAAWTVDALRTVWEHQRGRVGERIDTLERAIAALSGENRLDAALQEQARRAAHMLAGSLGMFGFLRAARAAHCLELELAHPTRERAPVLAALVASVRSGIRGPVTLPAESRSRRSSTPQS